MYRFVTDFKTYMYIQMSTKIIDFMRICHRCAELCF